MEVFFIIAAWLLGSIVAYNYTSKWEKQSKFNQVFFAAVWPATLILYLIHLVSKK